MLAAMVVSGFSRARNVRGVRCEIETVGEVVATRPAWLKVKLENRLKAGTAQSLFFLHEALPGRSGSSRSLRGRSGRSSSKGFFPRRGRATATRTPGLLSRFPLGLFRKYRHAELAREIVVYPLPEASAVPEIPPEDARGGRPHPRSAGAARTAHAARVLAGRRPRDLHWKQSARMRRWIVREREAERDRASSSRSTTRSRSRSTPRRSSASRRRFARCAARPAAALARRRGRLPRSRRQGRGRGGRSQRLRILEALARLEPVPPDTAQEFPAMRRGDVRMVRLVVDRRTMPPGLSRAYLLALAPAAFLAPLRAALDAGLEPLGDLLYE
jgi:uncharacterized protein (DUF58 family)